MKRVIKKTVAVGVTLSMSMALMAGCGGSNGSDTSASANTDAQQSTAADGEVYTVGIVQHLDHPSLNQINAKIQEVLQPLVEEGKVEIVEKNASGDQTMLPTIIKGLVDDGCDMLIPIATPTAQAAAAATSEIPIVFSAVSNPVEAGLVEAFDKTDKNITGVSNSIPIEEIFKLAAELTPDAKTFGLVYNTSEINSVTGIERAKEYCDANDLEYKEATVTGTADVAQAASSIASEVDAFFTPNDNTVASAMAAYLQVADGVGIPIYCGADSMVNDGGFATVGIDYDVLGQQTGEMAERIINGATIAETPVEQIAEYAKMINVATADKLGIIIDANAQKDFRLLGGE